MKIKIMCSIIFLTIFSVMLSADDVVLTDIKFEADSKTFTSTDINNSLLSGTIHVPFVAIGTLTGRLSDETDYYIEPEENIIINGKQIKKDITIYKKPNDVLISVKGKYIRRDTRTPIKKYSITLIPLPPNPDPNHDRAMLESASFSVGGKIPYLCHISDDNIVYSFVPSGLSGDIDFTFVPFDQENGASVETDPAVMPTPSYIYNDGPNLFPDAIIVTSEDKTNTFKYSLCVVKQPSGSDYHGKDTGLDIKYLYKSYIKTKGTSHSKEHSRSLDCALSFPYFAITYVNSDPAPTGKPLDMSLKSSLVVEIFKIGKTLNNITSLHKIIVATDNTVALYNTTVSLCKDSGDGIWMVVMGCNGVVAFQQVFNVSKPGSASPKIVSYGKINIPFLRPEDLYNLSVKLIRADGSVYGVVSTGFKGGYSIYFAQLSGVGVFTFLNQLILHQKPGLSPSVSMDEKFNIICSYLSMTDNKDVFIKSIKYTGDPSIPPHDLKQFVENPSYHLTDSGLFSYRDVAVTFFTPYNQVDKLCTAYPAVINYIYSPLDNSIGTGSFFYNSKSGSAAPLDLAEGNPVDSGAYSIATDADESGTVLEVHWNSAPGEEQKIYYNIGTASMKNGDKKPFGSRPLPIMQKL